MNFKRLALTVLAGTQIAAFTAGAQQTQLHSLKDRLDITSVAGREAAIQAICTVSPDERAKELQSALAQNRESLRQLTLLQNKLAVAIQSFDKTEGKTLYNIGTGIQVLTIVGAASGTTLVAMLAGVNNGISFKAPLIVGVGTVVGLGLGAAMKYNSKQVELNRDEVQKADALVKQTEKAIKEEQEFINLLQKYADENCAH